MTSKASKSRRYLLINNVRRTMAIYWQIDRLALISYLSLIALQIIASILTVYFGSRIIGQLTLFFQHRPISSGHVYLLLLASAIAMLAERFAWRWLTFIDRRSWIKWYVRMTFDFNNATSALDMAQHDDPELQKKIQKVSQEYQYTPQNFANHILECTHAILRLLSSLVIVFTFAPWLIIVMGLSLVPGYLAEKRFSQLKWNLWGEKGDKPLLAHKTSSFLQEKNRLQETKVFGTRNYLLDFLNELHVDFYNRQLRHLKGTQSRAFLGLTTEVVAAAGVTFWLIHKVLTRSLSLANYSFYSGIILQFGSSLNLIASSLNFIYDNNQYMKDFFYLVDSKPQINSPSDALVIANDQPLSIEFKQVSFAYPHSTKEIIKDLSLTIAPGDSLALVGENGSGKTTLIKLLLRFYDVTNGELLINGVNIKQIDLDSYYQRVGILFQSFNDYPLSVRDNIALGNVARFSDSKAVISSSIEANADAFIKRYPKGYDQVLEPSFSNGLEPSGGQWQRIALARALFRKADILILDEPTAAVDAKSEYEIFKTLEQNREQRTTIIISHRFSTVRQAAKICVFDDGRIIESGNHQQLMKIKSGIYKEMFEKQAQGYK